MNNSRYTYLLEMVDCSIRDMKLDEVLEESIHRQEGPEQQQHLQYRLHTKYRMEGLQNLERLVARLRSLLVYNLSRFNSQATVVSLYSPARGAPPKLLTRKQRLLPSSPMQMRGRVSR